MDRDTARQHLNETFRDIFDDASLVIRDEMTASDVSGWDSLSHIDLIVAVEKQFRIKLTTSEVQGLAAVGDLISLVAKKAA